MIAVHLDFFPFLQIPYIETVAAVCYCSFSAGIKTSGDPFFDKGAPHEIFAAAFRPLPDPQGRSHNQFGL
jgi:hypothetical protein